MNRSYRVLLLAATLSIATFASIVFDTNDVSASQPPPATVDAFSIQRWSVITTGFYSLNIFGDGTLLAARDSAVSSPQGAPASGVMAAKIDPATGAIQQEIFAPNARSSIKLNGGGLGDDWLVGGYENVFALDENGNYLRQLRDLGCCNIPRFPLALDHVRDAAFIHANGQLFGLNMSTGNTDYFYYGAGDNFATMSIADTNTYYSAGRSGNLSKLDPTVAGAQWTRNVATGDLQPAAIAADGSIVVTSGSPHLAGTVSAGVLARILPDNTVAFNVAANAVTPPVIGANGLIYIGTQAEPIDEDGAGAVEAYDPSTGSIVWSTPVDGLPNDLLVGDDGAVYVGTGGYGSGRVYSIAQSDGTVRQVITNVPSAWEIVLRAGLIYASGREQFGGNATVTALPVAANNYDVNSPWPVRYHDNQRTSNRTHTILTPPRIQPPPTPTPTPGPPCNGTPTFTQMTPVPTSGTYQQGLEAGDFNEDGNQDLVFSNFTTNLVSIRFGDGAGGFSGTTDLASPAPWEIAKGDFNQDQNLDFAVMSNDSGFVRVWLGNGSGAFSGPTVFNMGAQWPTGFDAVDINLDGNLDLLSVNFSTNNIALMYGNGNGGLGSPVYVPVGAGPSSAVAADFNGDGFVDLASSNYYANSLSIMLGSSSGTFSPALDVPVGNGPIMVRAGNFNSDGNIDLAVNNRNGDTLSILIGDGTGNFLPGNTLPTSATPHHMVLDDLNNDGKTDIVVVPQNQHSTNLFLGDGSGGFTQLPLIHADYNSARAALADFNNDGTVDIATSNVLGSPDRIIIHLGGCTPAPTPTPTPEPTPLPNVSISTAVSNFPEGSGTTVSFDRTTTGGDLYVSFTIAGSASYPADYSVSSPFPFTYDGVAGSITFPDGVDVVTFTVNSVQDNETEGDEDIRFNVELRSEYGTGNTFVGLTIEDVPSDVTAPVSSAAPSPLSNGTGWNNTDVNVFLTAEDESGGSGIASITYSASGAETIAATTVTGNSTNLNVTAEGETTVTYFATDAAGNVEAGQTITIKIDKTAPNVSASATAGGNPYSSGTWINADVTVTFDCTDGGSGVDQTASPANLSSEGAGQSVSGSCTDNAGNSSSTTFTGINIDKTAPVFGTVSNVGTVATSNAGASVLYATPSVIDNLIGSVSPICMPSSGSIFPIGVSSVLCSASDLAGNQSTQSFTVSVTKAVSNITINAPSSIVNGSSVTLSGILTGTGGSPLAGRTVTFSIGSGISQQTCSAVTAPDGSAMCTIANAAQPSGSVAATAAFSPSGADLYYSGSTATVNVGINSTAVVTRHAPTLNNGTVTGGLRVLLGESFNINSGTGLSSLFLAGTPNLVRNQGTYGTIVSDGGLSTPSSYTVTLNGGTIGTTHKQSDPLAFPSDIPTSVPTPAGTRNVTINTLADISNIGSWSTVRSLTVNLSNTVISVPSGNYYSFTLNGGNSKLVFSGGTYNVSNTIVLNNSTRVEIGAASVINIGAAMTLNGGKLLPVSGGGSDSLRLNVIGSGLTVNANSEISGEVRVPNGTLTLNSSTSKLMGNAWVDRFTLNGNGQVLCSVCAY